MIASWPLKRYLYDRMRRKQRDLEPRIHQVRFAPTALNVDVVDQAKIEPAEPFMLFAVTGYAFDTATGLKVTPNALVTVRLGGTGGRSLSRDAMHWGNLVGEQTMPFYVGAPILLPGGSILNTTLTLLTGPLTLNLGILFLGARVRRWTVL